MVTIWQLITIQMKTHQKKEFMLRVRMNTTTLTQLRELAEIRQSDMSKIIRDLIKIEHSNENQGQS
jgi:hypothetical protein